MAISIRHRFHHRLTPSSDNFEFINTIIVGTFNPGHPDKSTLTTPEQNDFETILLKPKFQRFDSVKNFYDRPQNRFWGVMDRLNNPVFYKQHGIKTPNLSGLKYYKKGLDREQVFQKQMSFCKAAGLFITDFVKEVKPENFNGIYDNFADSIIEKSNCIWNTEEIISAIEIFKPKKVLINFKTENSAIQKISAEAQKIKKLFPKITTSVLSTSGAATNHYEDLLKDWTQHIFIK